VLLGNQSKFACVDGPEFDASLVNFDVLMQRNAMYRGQECQSLKAFEQHRQEELARHRATVATKEKESAQLRAKLEKQGLEKQGPGKPGLDAQGETSHV
jgi:ferredoxin--NADP+ reductase